MPIEFAQPEPVAPQISSAYGRAQQWSQDSPTLANLAVQTAAHNQQSAAQAQQQVNANANLGYEAANAQANRYSAGDAANANREQQALDLGASLTQQNDAITYQANAAAAAAQQHAQLAAYVNSQDMTQKEQMRLTQQQAALADVWNDPSLAPEERSAMAMQIKTGIDPLAQKLKATQQKHTEMQNQLIQQQTAHELTKNDMQVKYANMNFDQLVKTRATPDAQAEFEAEANQQNMTPQERDAYVQKRAGETGRLTNWVYKPSSDGRFEWHHVPPDKTTKDDAQKQQMAAWKDYHAARDAASKETDAYMKVEGNQGKDWHTIFNDTMKTHGIAPTFAEHLAQFGLAPGAAGKRGAAPPPPTTTPPTPGDDPEVVKQKTKALADENPPYPPGQAGEKGTAAQQQMHEDMAFARQEALSNPNLPMKAKEQIITAADQVQSLLSEYGSPQRMQLEAQDQSVEKEKRDRAERSYKLYNQALKLVKARTQAQPQPNRGGGPSTPPSAPGPTGGFPTFGVPQGAMSGR